MSDIKINGSTYREEDVAFNWGVEFVKAMVDAHSRKGIIDHADGSVTMPKLATEVTDLINNAVAESNNNKTELAQTDKFSKDNRTVYKVYQLKAGETFTIKPNMFCLVLPYGGKTVSIHKSDDTQVFSGNAGFTLCFAPEIDTGEYANGHNHRVAFFYQPSNSLSPLASHHDLLEVGAYFKNNGDGNMYVYAVMREVDAV